LLGHRSRPPVIPTHRQWARNVPLQQIPGAHLERPIEQRAVFISGGSECPRSVRKRLMGQPEGAKDDRHHAICQTARADFSFGPLPDTRTALSDSWCAAYHDACGQACLTSASSDTSAARTLRSRSTTASRIRSAARSSSSATMAASSSSFPCARGSAIVCTPSGSIPLTHLFPSTFIAITPGARWRPESCEGQAYPRTRMMTRCSPADALPEMRLSSCPRILPTCGTDATPNDDPRKPARPCYQG